MVFIKDFITADDGSLISIRYIESIRFLSESEVELRVIEKLKDDLYFDIVTTSGRMYTVSTKEQFTWELTVASNTLPVARSSIVDRWKYILKGPLT